MKNLILIQKILTKAIEIILMIFFLVIISVTVLLVILRYVFNKGIFGGNELISYLFIYTTAMGAAVSIVKREHIKITYFIDKLPSVLRIIVDIIGHLLIIFINGIMVFYSLNWVKIAGVAESPTLRIPMYTVFVSVPIGCSLVIIYSIYLIIIDLANKYNQDNGVEDVHIID
jgi:TRAP-type C4-dicarboxylate transport system permease small subunit